MSRPAPAPGSFDHHRFAYRQHMAASGRFSQKACSDWQIGVRNFQRHYEPARVEDIDTEAVLRWLISASMRDHALKTRQCYVSQLRGFCKWLVSEGVLHTDPTYGVHVRSARIIHRPTTTGTVHDLIDPFLDQMRLHRHYCALSAKGARSRLRVFDAFFGDRPISDLTRAVIEAWMLTVEDRAANTIRSYLETLRTFSRWLIEHGYIETNPVKGIPFPKVPRTVPRSFSSAQAAAVVAACRNDRERLVILLQLEMGLRAVEISRARWADYDPEQATLLVHGKGGHERLLPVMASVADLLAKLPTVAGMRPIVGLVRDPLEPISSTGIQHVTHEVLWRSGVRTVSFDGRSGHALRHTAASDVLARSRDLQAVQRLLGHAFIETTVRYVREIDIDQLRAAMEGRDYGTATSTALTAPLRLPVIPGPLRWGGPRR